METLSSGLDRDLVELDPLDCLREVHLKGQKPRGRRPPSHMGGHWFGREALRQSPVRTFAPRVSRELTLSLVVHSWHSQVKK